MGVGPCLPGARRDIVLVSAGLGLDGGGRAAAGRLLAGAVAELARRQGVGLSVLTLGSDGAPGLEVPTRCFGASHAALAARTWAGQLRARRPAYVFDFLGPARAQVWLPRALRAPYLVVLYGIDVWRPLGGDRARALRDATVRLAISRYTVERARPYCPAMGSVEVVPLALEERAPSGEIDRDLVERAGDGFLLIVGRMASGERYKGHDELLEALAAMPAMPAMPARPPMQSRQLLRAMAANPALADRVRSARLVIAGDGDDRPRLEARAVALGLGRRVIFTGFVGEATLAELYRRAAAFVMPSLGEGFGLVYLEAMRAGIPCVAARGGAAEEVVADGETGLLVDPGDREELAAALNLLLADPDLARRMGAAGRRRWRCDFSAERYREHLAPHLERLTAA